MKAEFILYFYYWRMCNESGYWITKTCHYCRLHCGVTM